jgi:excisionase family DNA binding protein
MLGTLAALAEEVGRPDLRMVFTNAFWRELNEEIGRKLQIEVPRLHSHYKALLWLTLNGGQRSQTRVENFLKDEIARVAKERKRELTHEERQTLGSLTGGEEWRKDSGVQVFGQSTYRLAITFPGNEVSVMSNLLTCAETAKRMKISKGQLSKLINGKVPGVPPLKTARLGRRVLVREDTLERWLEEVESCNMDR